MLTSAIGFSKSGSLPIQILSVKSWAMHAQVAEHYSNSYKNIYLLGDAAHRFPPAGGFGMNTGIQDAHNLAWKIAMTINMKSDKNLLDSYEAGWTAHCFLTTIDYLVTIQVHK